MEYQYDIMHRIFTGTRASRQTTTPNMHVASSCGLRLFSQNNALKHCKLGAVQWAHGLAIRLGPPYTNIIKLLLIQKVQEIHPLGSKLKCIICIKKKKCVYNLH